MYACMYACLDDGRDGGMEGWRDEWMESWTDGRTDLDGWMDGWMESCAATKRVFALRRGRGHSVPGQMSIAGQMVQSFSNEGIVAQRF